LLWVEQKQHDAYDVSGVPPDIPPYPREDAKAARVETFMAPRAAFLSLGVNWTRRDGGIAGRVQLGKS